MSSSETPSSVASPEIRRYVSDVDDLLLDIPWRRRRELIADLVEHLEANPEQIQAESPREYAAELRESAPVATAGLLSGLRSLSWPTPLAWWESVVRGAALLLVVWVAYDFLAAASQRVFGDPSSSASWPAMLKSALQSVYPGPTVLGSHRTGLLVFPLLAVLAGQLTTAATLSRAPQLRSKLRILTYLSILVIIGLLGYGAVTG